MYELPLVSKPGIAIHNCLAVIKFELDDKRGLQLVTADYTADSAIRVKSLSIITTDYRSDIGRVILSRSHKRAWLDDGYCYQLKGFKILK